MSVREDSKKAFNGCFVTCFLTERKGRNKPFGGDFCVVFGPPDPSKRVLGGGRPVCRGGGGGGDDGENGDFRWFLDLKGPLKTSLEGVRPVVSNFKPH